MIFKQIFEPKLAQYSYLIASSDTKEAVIIDPMRDIQRYLDLAKDLGVEIIAAADTHIHADFLSGAQELAAQGARIYAFNSPHPYWRFQWLEDSDYDHKLLDHGQRFQIGEVSIQAVHTPGHSPEHVSYLIEDGRQDPPAPLGIITGDFVFVGDLGRPDLMDPSGEDQDAQVQAARALFNSLDRFRVLPGDLPVLPGHGAGSACGKSMSPHPHSTVAQELKWNQSIRAADTEANFVEYILDGQPEPPTYFSRMREWNRSGVPILNEFPPAAELSSTELNTLLKDENTVIVDARSWPEYQDAHLQGSLFAGIDGSFPTIAACYIEPDKDIVLVIHPNRLAEAIQDLIHVGLDKVVGYIAPNHLTEFEQSGGLLDNIDDISVFELQEIATNGNFHILDVRRASELVEEGYVQGAQNIAHTTLSQHLEEIPTSKPLAIYCRGSVRSTYAAAYLKKQGFEVVNVYGGFNAWAGSGLPVSGSPRTIQLM